MSELAGATQLCPARQKMPWLGLSEGGIQTRGDENVISIALRLFQGPKEIMKYSREPAATVVSIF